MEITVTGHRPNKLIGGWNSYENKGGKGLKIFIPFLCNYFEGLDVTEVNLGCAAGFDTIVAFACIEANIPYNAFVPFQGFDKKWSQRSKNTLDYILNNAKYVNIPLHVPTEYWDIARMLNQRNEDMIDIKPDCVIALWNGSEGGTKNCLKYAKKKEIPILNVWHEYEFIATKKEDRD